jgi:hypothetical protein
MPVNTGSFAAKEFDDPGNELSVNTRVTFLFNITKAADIPDFQTKFANAIKRAIELCGGVKAVKDPFGT